jgi:hypothetical protein
VRNDCKMERTPAIRRGQTRDPKDGDQLPQAPDEPLPASPSWNAVAATRHGIRVFLPDTLELVKSIATRLQ